MIRYIIKRILWLIPVIVCVITIVFVITTMTPGDPVTAMLGADAPEASRVAMTIELGLDKPVITRWFNYVVGFFTRFDLGTSYATRQPVRDELMTRVPVTLMLAFASTLIGVAVGIPMGVWSALRQYTWVDNAILVLSVVGISMPSFWLALLLINEFSVNLGWLPSFGITKMSGWVLPVIVASFAAIAGEVRITRSSMLEVMRQDYIRTAQAKGQREGVIIMRHMLRNALIPVITSTGAQLGNAIGGNVALETVFSLPGVGNYIVSAIAARNYSAMEGGILIIAVIFTLINLIVDLAYVAADPRLKTQLTAKKMSKRSVALMLKEQEGAVHG